MVFHLFVVRVKNSKPIYYSMLLNYLSFSSLYSPFLLLHNPPKPALHSVALHPKLPLKTYCVLSIYDYFFCMLFFPVTNPSKSAPDLPNLLFLLPTIHHIVNYH